MHKDNDIEAKLEELLREGEMETEEQSEAARRRLLPRTEIRIQTKMDPIVEETLIFRSMAQEVDDRYDRYMQRAKEQKPDSTREED